MSYNNPMNLKYCHLFMKAIIIVVCLRFKFILSISYLLFLLCSSLLHLSFPLTHLIIILTLKSWVKFRGSLLVGIFMAENLLLALAWIMIGNLRGLMKISYLK